MRAIAAGLLVLLLATEAAAEGKTKASLQVSSPAFTASGAIPSRYTCEGGETIPPLTFSGAPKETKSLALLVDDPDAPAGTWVHWVVWNIKPDAPGIAEGTVPSGAIQGKNSWKKNVYGAPCPPSGTHRYFFRLFALDTRLDLPPKTGAKELRKAMEGHVLGIGELMGTYRKK